MAIRKIGLLGMAAACCLLVSACATAPNGDYTVFGQDIGAKDLALVAKYNIDLQNFVASVPTACRQATSVAGFSQSTVAVAKQIFSSIKPKTAANLNNIAQDVANVCAGIAILTPPPAAASGS